MDHGGEAVIGFVGAQRDAFELLELAEEVLDQMPPFAHLLVGSLLSWARFRSPGRKRSFAGTVLGFGRIGARDHATIWQIEGLG